MNDGQKTRLRYIKTGVFVLLAIGLCIWLEEPFAAETTKDLIGNLCDCFTVPGIVFLGIGGLTWVGRMGGFDSFGYLFSNFSLHNLWVTGKKKKYESLYDYKQAKEEKGRHWLSHFAVLGAISLAVGILLLIVYFLL